MLGVRRADEARPAARSSTPLVLATGRAGSTTTRALAPGNAAASACRSSGTSRPSTRTAMAKANRGRSSREAVADQAVDRRVDEPPARRSPRAPGRAALGERGAARRRRPAGRRRARRTPPSRCRRAPVADPGRHRRGAARAPWTRSATRAVDVAHRADDELVGDLGGQRGGVQEPACGPWRVRHDRDRSPTPRSS